MISPFYLLVFACTNKLLMAISYVNVYCFFKVIWYRFIFIGVCLHKQVVNGDFIISSIYYIDYTFYKKVGKEIKKSNKKKKAPVNTSAFKIKYL